MISSFTDSLSCLTFSHYFSREKNPDNDEKNCENKIYTFFILRTPNPFISSGHSSISHFEIPAMNNPTPTSIDTQTTTATTSASSSAASTATHHQQLLNLPSTMSRSNLTFQTLTPTPNPNSNRIDRMINSNSTSRSPSQTIYSDRFIPSRSGSNFSLFDISPTKKSDDGAPSMYTTLLKTALFGVVVPPVTPDKRASVHRNIFRYKSETKQSMHSLLPFGFDDDAYSGVVQSPVRTPRKIAKSPFKV